jgi:hypothetical protein
MLFIFSLAAEIVTPFLLYFSPIPFPSLHYTNGKKRNVDKACFMGKEYNIFIFLLIYHSRRLNIWTTGYIYQATINLHFVFMPLTYSDKSFYYFGGKLKGNKV